MEGVVGNYLTYSPLLCHHNNGRNVKKHLADPFLYRSLVVKRLIALAEGSNPILDYTDAAVEWEIDTTIKRYFHLKGEFIQ